MFEEEYNRNECRCNKNDCVCQIVKYIADVQAEAEGNEDCEVGCKESIRSLVSPAAAAEHDTIPFLLYCDCDLFVGQSVVQRMVSGNRVFNCLESPIFRVSKVKDNCCAVLELLLPITEDGSTPGPGGDNICDFFPGNSIRNLRRTNVCITVDLCKFDGIACLEPVTALPRV
ncbi:CotY/CotZ family spore coat protein [Bacillaceae bacterium W0354]